MKKLFVGCSLAVGIGIVALVGGAAPPGTPHESQPRRLSNEPGLGPEHVIAAQSDAAAVFGAQRSAAEDPSIGGLRIELADVHSRLQAVIQSRAAGSPTVRALRESELKTALATLRQRVSDAQRKKVSPHDLEIVHSALTTAADLESRASGALAGSGNQSLQDLAPRFELRNRWNRDTTAGASADAGPLQAPPTPMIQSSNVLPTVHLKYELKKP
jgi:hypothetical protein